MLFDLNPHSDHYRTLGSSKAGTVRYVVHQKENGLHVRQEGVRPKELTGACEFRKQDQHQKYQQDTDQLWDQPASIIVEQ